MALTAGPDDVARSLRRYAMLMLGEPWRIDLERLDASDDERPAGIIELGRTSTEGGAIARPSPQSRSTVLATVVLYPSLASPRLAGRTARALADSLERMIVLGIEGPMMDDGRPASGPYRVPSWDWREVPLYGTLEERQPPEHAVGTIHATDPEAEAVQDPEDPQRWTVLLQVRLTWDRAGLDAPDAPIVETVRGRPVFVPPPGGGVQ